MIRDESENRQVPDDQPKQEPVLSTADKDASCSSGAIGDGSKASSTPSGAAEEDSANPPRGAAAADGSGHRKESPESFKIGKLRDVTWGPQYSPATARYVVGSRDNNSYPTKYRHDEVFDFLRGQRQGNPVYPRRLRDADVSNQQLKDFRKSVKRSFALTENEGELVLMHEVLPGHRAGEGTRTFSHGLKIVPTKAMAKILVCKEHAEMHYGSMVTDLNKDYVIPSGFLLEIRADVKRQCKLCGDITNTPEASLRRRCEIGMRAHSSHAESGAQGVVPDTSSNQAPQELLGDGSSGDMTERHEGMTSAPRALPNGGGLSEQTDGFRHEVPPFSAGPARFSAGPPLPSAMSQENVPCGQVGRKSLKRLLPREDPSVTLLDELSVDSVTNAVLGIQRPGMDHDRRVAVVVWNIGHCGGNPFLLKGIVDRLARGGAVDDHTRVLVLDDERSRLEERRCDVHGVSKSREEVVTATVEATTHALQIVLDKEDPSLPRNDESNKDPRLIMGTGICRVKEARTPCMAHAPDRDWDVFLRDTRSPGWSAPSRSLYPSVETLEAFLYRAGATMTKGVVVVASDPFAAWAEACARLKLSCVVFVGAKPTAGVRKQVEVMWRKITTTGGMSQ